MRFSFTLLLALFFGSYSSAQSQPSGEDVDEFFASVATGGVSAVVTALSENPMLATATDKYGFQAVHVLGYIDFEKNLATLLERGADINSQNDEGIGLLHILIDTEFLPPVLLAGANLELKDELGRTPVMVHLTEPEGLSMVAALLQAGADPNATDSRGQSVLDYARLWNDPLVTQIVVDAGGVNLN